MPVAPGQTYGPYVVEAPLGAGGLASVWRVRQGELGTLAALKVLHVTTPAMQERLLREDRLQGGLRHPNVLAVLDVVDVGGVPGLVLQFIDGPPLNTVVGLRLDLGQIDALARSMLAGLAAAHDQGLVHRDLKPANILLSLAGGAVVPKVADFGLAKAFGAGPGMTRTGAMMGTPQYMAPE